MASPVKGSVAIITLASAKNEIRTAITNKKAYLFILSLHDT
jgi:hypothetical protein